MSETVDQQATSNLGPFRLLPIDASLLVKPIDGDDGPAGPSLRYDAVYDKIQQARRADDPNLPQGIWETELKRADWDLVIQETANALMHRSKDLQLAAWLTEAATHRHSFEGLAEASTALRGLIEAFLPDLHPLSEPDDRSALVAPLEWIAAKLPPIVRTQKLTFDQGPDAKHYTLVDWIESRRATDQDEGIPIRTKIRNALDNTGIDWRRRKAEAIDDTFRQLSVMSAMLDEKLGHASPGLGELQQVLLDAQHFLNRDLGQPTVSDAASNDHPNVDGSPDRQTPGLSGKALAERSLELGTASVRSRSDAYAKLAMLADYLIELEPHSPAPYLVRRAVTWGDMPLPILLKELAREYGDVDRLQSGLGLGAPKDD